jgi:hypothetical protein
MKKELLVGLMAASILSAGWLYAQDSSDDSDSSDAATTRDASPGDVSVTDVSEGVAAAADPTSLTAFTNVDFAAQQAYDAITTPWGGVPGPVTFGNANQLGPNGNPVPGEPGNPGAIPAPPTTGAPSPHRAQIHAVIVSNLSDPSQVLSGNVDLTGGIIALGPPTGSLKPGRWDPRVRIIPDPDLLNGSKIPPLVPNVIDVRITHYEVTRTIESQGSVSDRP